MNHGNLNFDATQVEPDSGQNFEPLPAGEYPVIVCDSVVLNTKTGTGQYLKLQLQVIGGPYENRRLFTNITLTNQNPQAQQIGQSQLSALCHAVGKLQVGDSAELHDIPFVVKVGIKDDKQYGPQNVVRAFMPSNPTAQQGYQQQAQPAAQGYQAPPQPQQQPQQGGYQQQPAQAAPPAGGASGVGSRPWERK